MRSLFYESHTAMECLFLLVLALTHLHTIQMQQILSLSNEKCSFSPSVNEDIKSMVTLMYERGEKQRADRENATLRNNNDISDLNIDIADVRAEFTEISNTTKKQRAYRDNATLYYNNAISDLKAEITDLRAKVTDLTNSTSQIYDRIRNIYGLIQLSEDGKVLIQDDMAYLISDKRLSWSQAWSFCRNKEAILVNILDSSMSRYLTSKLADYRDDFWIGGIKTYGVYFWKTETGYSPITWSNWVPGEPGSTSPGCIQLWEARGHKWDNTYCSHQKRFICSKSLI